MDEIKTPISNILEDLASYLVDAYIKVPLENLLDYNHEDWFAEEAIQVETNGDMFWLIPLEKVI